MTEDKRFSKQQIQMEIWFINPLMFSLLTLKTTGTSGQNINAIFVTMVEYTNWLVVSTLWKILVSWDDYSQYMEK